ncbi:hypothetical protein ACOMHN_030461 [Nucella lapillus]
MQRYSSLESLSLPRRQKVFDTQLVPAGDPLPIWSSLPLDSKLPVVPCPRGSYTLYTTKVGQPKYIHKQHYDFDLGNALYAKPSEYDSLQDPFLKEYFKKPRTKRLLEQNKLITRDGKVKCDIKEFNKYRSYLRYRSVTELSLQRSGEREEGEERGVWGRAVKTEVPRNRLSVQGSRAPSHRDSDSSQEGALHGRDVNLIQRMRQREKTLMTRMWEKERQRQKEYEQRLKESWQGRKQRQNRLLQHEADVDEKMREVRARQLLQREKTLAQQRNRMMAKLGRSPGGRKRGEGERREGGRRKTDTEHEHPQRQTTMMLPTMLRHCLCCPWPPPRSVGLFVMYRTLLLLCFLL